MSRFPQVKKLTTAAAFDARCAELGIELPRVGEPGDAVRALAEPLEAAGHRVGNRFCILPMEGWDATSDGAVTDLVRRRWARFGESGAKLVWGGEAVAVRHDGRANPHQLRLGVDTVEDIADLRVGLVVAHEAVAGTSDDLLVGLQLTHSGRYARPDGAPAPRTAYRHPVLDGRLGIDDSSTILSDDELDELVADVVAAAVLAQQAGFAFVDVKHCHGYLGHELLSGIDRPGRYGGDLTGRTRFLRSVVEGIRSDAPGLGIGVRLSAFDMVPYRHGDERGEPDLEPGAAYPFAFGGDGTGPGTNSYLVGDPRSGYIAIDPGPADAAHIERLWRAAGGRIRYIVCTHSHPDHSPGARPLQALCEPLPPILGLASQPTARAHSQFSPDRLLQDQELLTLTGQSPDGEITTHTLRAIHTPGHAANHLCLLLEEDGLLFSGDHILNGSTTVIDPPDGDMTAYLDSLDKLDAACAEHGARFILPAHGHVLGRARETIAHLKAHRLAREAKVLAVMKADPHGTMDDWVARAYDDVPERVWPVARRSLQAHVERIRAMAPGND